MAFWLRTAVVATVLMGTVFAQETSSQQTQGKNSSPASQDRPAPVVQAASATSEQQNDAALLAQADGTQSQSNPQNGAGQATNTAPAANSQADSQSTQNATSQDQSQYERAQQELKQQEQQRILGVVPNFNTTDVQNAAPLTSGQKFRLAMRSAVDPFQFVAAGLDAGISQAQNDFPGYGQGAQGYAKRFGAAYADQFSGEFWGNWFFPAILHEDPRYYRRGHGSFQRRLLWAIFTTVWTRNDNGTWGPNYANVLGNIAAGGLANAYYPSSDRGLGLTFQRAFTVTAEGAIGSSFVEFWPDIDHWLFHRHQQSKNSSATASSQQ
jgi:hypothetical protein